MGFFGVDKSNKSSTVNEPTNTYTDQSANAGGDGSVSAGAGAALSINIQNLSEKVANEAIDQNAYVSAVAIDSGSKAVTGAYNLSRDAIAGGVKQTEFTVNTLLGLQEVAARENQDTRSSAQNAIDSNAGLTEHLNTLTSSALERAQAPEASSIAAILKPILIALAAIFGLFVLMSNDKKTAHAAHAKA